MWLLAPLSGWADLIAQAEMLPYAALAAGLVLAGGGGEMFVRGTVGLAAASRVSPAVAAVTVAAFATSSPELTVAVSSALAGEPEISLGDAIGSNLVNIALVLGLALLFGPLSADRRKVGRDFLAALAAPALLWIALLDGMVGRADALLLVAAFVAWLLMVVRAAHKERATSSGQAIRLAGPVTETMAGLVLLIIAGKLIVFGAAELARRYGLSEFVIGATVVALGTSTPELATVMIARLRGHEDISLASLLGSNIFNSLFIVGVAGAIAPIRVAPSSAAPALVCGALALAFAYPGSSGVIARWRGAALLTFYAAYLAATLITRP
jgi:cation:H+ antiporter